MLDVLESGAAEVFSGQLDGLSSSFADIGELGSIANFQANLSYSRDISAISARSIGRISHRAGDASREAPPTDKPAEAKILESRAPELAKAAGKLEDENRMDKLPRRFIQLFQKLAENLALDEHERKLADRILSELLKRRHAHHHENDKAGRAESPHRELNIA